MRLRAAGLLAVLAAGCGTSDADRVRATLADLGDADARTLCRDVLSADLIAAQERITGRPCAATARSLVGRPGRRVREIRVDGDLATARLGAETVTLVRTRAGWRLASLGNDGGGSPSRP
jgi:hypothetical protein